MKCGLWKTLGFSVKVAQKANDRIYLEGGAPHSAVSFANLSRRSALPRLGVDRTLPVQLWMGKT